MHVPTFADSRLQALLAASRESELLQAALRGRPLDHPDAQITLLFGLPLAGLSPTEITEAEASSTSNAGRQARALTAILAAGQRLLDAGQRTLTVRDLAEAAGVSAVTIREHCHTIATHLHLRSRQHQRTALMPKGGRRVYQLLVLVKKGRRVISRAGTPLASLSPTLRNEAEGNDSLLGGMTDQACNIDSIMRLIRHSTTIDGSSRPAVVLRLKPRRASRWGIRRKQIGKRT